MQPIKKTIRAAAPLTTGYVVGDVIANAGGMDQLVLGVAFTKGSLTSATIKIEFNLGGSTWYPETTDSASPTTFTRTYTADFTGVIAIPIMFSSVRVSVIGVGTTTGSSMAIEAYLGRQNSL